MLLTADQLRERAKALPFEDVEIPEWGGSVRVRSITTTDLDAWEAENYRYGAGGKLEVNRRDVRSRFLARCLVGEDGRPLLTSDDIRAWPAAIADRLLDVAQRLSGIDRRAQELAEKNSGTGLGAGSCSDSPCNSAAPSPSCSPG